MLRRLGKDVAIYTLGPQVPVLIGVFMIPILTPFLTPKDYGIQGTLMAWIGSIVAIKDLGLNVVISNLYYKYPKNYQQLWNRLFTILSGWAIFLAIINGFIISYVLPNDQSANYWLLVLAICVPFAITDTTNFFVNRFFQLEQKPSYPVFVSIVSGIASLLASYYFIKVQKMGYLGMFYATGISSFTAFFINIFTLFNKFNLRFNFRITFKWIKSKLAISLPLVPHYYSVFLLDTSDRIILNFYKVEIKDIGIYNYGYMLGSYFQIVTNAIGIAAGPIYLTLFHKRNQESEIQARNLTLLMQFTLSLAAFNIALWMKEIISVLVRNPELAACYYVILIQSYVFCNHKQIVFS